MPSSWPRKRPAGCSHNYIGTEHVLLGLLGEPDGLACRALEGLGMSLEAARNEVTAIVGTGSAAPSGHIPFTPRAKKTLELALREALQLHHNYIGTEHVLLGLVTEGEGVAAQVLKQHADLTAVRVAVLDLLPAASAESARARRWLRRPAAAGPGEADAPAEQPVLNYHPGRGHHPHRGRPPGRLAAGRLPPPAARRSGRPRHRRRPGPGRSRRRPEPGQADAPQHGHHRHQRRAARRGGPPPDGHPGDRRTAHH